MAQIDWIALDEVMEIAENYGLIDEAYAARNAVDLLRSERDRLRTRVEELEADRERLKRDRNALESDWTKLCGAIVTSPTVVECRHHRQVREIDIDHIRQRLISVYYRLEDERKKRRAALGEE